MTTLSPVLLLGAGRGEASCGILYIASFLRRNGVEAFVRLVDHDDEEALKRSLTDLVAHVKPRVVGISLKWYLHVHRAVVIARALRKIDPTLRIVLGGNTAALYWRELLAHDCIDDVILGDGEVPLLALCQGHPAPPNLARRGADGVPVRAPFGYVQANGEQDTYYSHFDKVFLSQFDLQGFSGWVSPGKGCRESCVYCGGRRAAQRLSFGRPDPFLRATESVQRDHHELASRVWQFRYDFPGGSTEYMCEVWPGLELGGHSATYFLWGVPAPRLVEMLSRTFARVFMVLDIGCFSQSQRAELMQRGLLKPCPTDSQLMAAIDDCLRHKNLELEVCGIAGLPLTSDKALVEERALVERMLERGCAVGYQRLQSQPGALVTEHPERFGMATEARTFDDFFGYFSKRSNRGVPMVTYADRKLEKAVQRNCERLDELLATHTAKKAPVITERTRLRATVTSRREVGLGDWLGRYRVPRSLEAVPVTVLRSHNGAGLACAPDLDPDDLEDAVLQQCEAGAAILSTLEIFRQPNTVAAGVTKLGKAESLDEASANELIDHLVSRRFLSPV